MRLSICSYSFHRMLAAGKQDIFRYILDCKSLGCTQLDPWMAHLPLIERVGERFKGTGAEGGTGCFLNTDEIAYLGQVRRAADEAGLPFGCIAVDGAHLYDADPAARARLQTLRYRWLDVATILGATQIRIDTGGTKEMPEEEFRLIVAGYTEIVARAKPRGIEVVMENHWGADQWPANIKRILAAVPGLGLLWDSYNFPKEVRREGREQLAQYARLTHIKAFTFDQAGNEPNEDIPHAIACLRKANYRGTIGIESCPPEGEDEIEAARKTIALIRRLI